MIETEWFVLTGAPSCGKTAVLQAMAARGCQCVEEAARVHIEGELAKGLPLERVRGDIVALQYKILAKQEELLLGVPHTEPVCLDRAAHLEVLPYLRVAGLPVPEDLQQVHQKYRHAHVFILDPLPLKKDGVRVENDEIAHRLDQEIERAYREAGYNVIRVPVISVPDDAPHYQKSIAARAEFIMDHLTERHAVSTRVPVLEKQKQNLQSAFADLTRACEKNLTPGSDPDASITL